jgi:hypothetical protein
MSTIRTPEGKYRCLFCAEKEYPYLSNLYRHHQSCSMNPDATSKKRSHSRSPSPRNGSTYDEGSKRSRSLSPRKDSGSDDEESTVAESRKISLRAFQKLIEGDATDEDFVKGVFAPLTFNPVAKGMLIQMFMDKKDEYGKKKAAFEEETRLNAKTKSILAFVNSESSAPVSTAASNATSSSNGILGGMFTY